MDLYDSIVDGFKKHVPIIGGGVEAYLKSLQKSVKSLRIAYRNSPVHVNYEDSDIQAAYLATYLPHYYQLIYNIFLEEVPDIFKGKKDVYLTFIGGGPGSEAYGAVKYIVNNCKSAKNIHVTILDINAPTWSFSHSIVQENVIRAITSKNLNVHWKAVFFDLVSEEEVKKVKSIVRESDLLVIQNCLNEIAVTNLPALKRNLKLLFEYLPGSSYFLMSDMTSGARTTIKALEHHLVNLFDPKLIKSTLSLSSSRSLISVHHRPSSIIAENLLVGTDGLIPRKNISYDYSMLSKGVIQEIVDYSGLGFNAIYRPLDFKKLDANDYIHKKIFIGIDFGTSSTVVSTAQLKDGKIVIKPIPIKQKDHLGGITSSPLVPTVIALINGNRLLVGVHAADHKPFLKYGKDCWHSFKQNLGILERIEYPDSVLVNHPRLKISNATEGLTFFLKFIKDQTFDYLKSQGLPLEVEYSISVPASFSSKEKSALKSCLLVAGIECEDTPFIEEPNAALINYLFEQNISFIGDAPKTILVLDLGAGTVDVSILHVENGDEGFTSKLLSVVRLGNIGGNLIDEIIADLIAQRAGIATRLNSTQRIELVSLCEKLKIKVCKQLFTDLSVNFLLPVLSTSDTIVSVPNTPSLNDIGIKTVSMSFREFDEIILQYWNGGDSNAGVKATIQTALKNANVDKVSVDKIIVTGGGGRNPYLKTLVAKYFNKSEVFISDNIQEQVSRGAALQSFVLNSFGKNIITPILGFDIYLKAANKSVPLFNSGIAIPSVDIEVYLASGKLNGDNYIECCSHENLSYQKYFLIPQHADAQKLVFYIAPDQELKCELIGSNTESVAEEIFDKPKTNSIKIK
ncbi:MAG: Hsp70 family protein [Chitinophagales bacterium]|nr:Hsp70 family protein [Chitinophagales bacterium]